MNRAPINREWSYCTEFEFFKFKKVLKAKNHLSLRMLTQTLSPWVSPGQLIQFDYAKRNRPQSFKYGDIVTYWDTEKISAGVYTGTSPDGARLIERRADIKLIKPVYLLARIPNLRLPWYKRLLILLRGPSALGRDPLLPRAPEESIHRNRAN